MQTEHTTAIARSRKRVVVVATAIVSVAALWSAGLFLAQGSGAAAAVIQTYTLFGAATPAVAATSSSSSVELGVRFAPRTRGWATGMRFYKGSGNGGSHVGTLWSPTGNALARVTFTNESATGWQHATFSSPVPVSSGVTYFVSYHAPQGHFAYALGYFARSLRTRMLMAPRTTRSRGNGLFAFSASSTFPTNSGTGTNFYVDVDFVTMLPPAVTTTTARATTTTKPATTTTRPTTTTTSATTATTTASTTTTTTPQGPPGITSAPTQPPVVVCGNHAILDGPSTAPSGAMTVPAGDNSAMFAFTATANTTYWFAPGVHTLGSGQYSQIVPANGDTFVGAPGAVIDGQKKNNFAFTQHATGVTIKNLEIRNFTSPTDQGVVNHDSGNNWTVTHSSIHDNGGAALMAGANNTISYNCLDHNGQYGINAYQGGDGITNLVVDHNEISRNNTANLEVTNPGCGCTGGVKFWAVNQARVTSNYVHDNLSVGLWADTNDRGFDIEGNYISGNTSEGILYEISYNAVIRYNAFIRNAFTEGPANPGFPTGAIYISESGGDSRVGGFSSGVLDISRNVFTDNWSGVVLWENADRFCGSPANSSTGYCTLVNPTVATVSSCNSSNIAKAPYFADCRWKTQNVSVHNNTFQRTTATIASCTAANGCDYNAVFSNYGTYPSWSPYTGTEVEDAITFHQNNVFSNNTYKGSWQYMAHELSDSMSFSSWRAAPYNQDAGSTSTP